MVIVWQEVLDLERVPADAYEELYAKALHQIAKTQADGRKAPELNAMLLSSCWVGDAELRWKHAPRPTMIQGHEIDRCRYCLDTGWEYVKQSLPREVARCRCGRIPGRKF